MNSIGSMLSSIISSAPPASGVGKSNSASSTSSQDSGDRVDFSTSQSQITVSSFSYGGKSTITKLTEQNSYEKLIQNQIDAPQVTAEEMQTLNLINQALGPNSSATLEYGNGDVVSVGHLSATITAAPSTAASSTSSDSAATAASTSTATQSAPVSPAEVITPDMETSLINSANSSSQAS